MKLNLGAGGVHPDGFTSVDLRGADVNHDLSEMPWPFQNSSATAILASHVLEHFDQKAGALFLRECARILKPDGILSVAVPDMDKFIEARLTGRWELLGGYLWTDLNDLLGGGENEPHPEQRHKYMYSWGSLAWALWDAGLQPKRVGFEDCALGAVHTAQYRAISLYVDAVKV
jgi:predicted SAM-dependent methyltransferase